LSSSLLILIQKRRIKNKKGGTSLPINKGGNSLPINKGGNSLPEGTPFYLNRDKNSSFFLYGSSSSPMGEIGSYLLAKLGKEPT